jgi:hypothetical protein
MEFSADETHRHAAMSHEKLDHPLSRQRDGHVLRSRRRSASGNTSGTCGGTSG